MHGSYVQDVVNNMSQSRINSLRPRDAYRTIIVSDNCVSPGRHQAIILTNAGILLIGPLWTNFNEISIGIQAFPFT